MPPVSKYRTHIDAPYEKIKELRELQAQLAEQDAKLIAEDRRALLKECPHPLALAKHFQPENIVVTPAMTLVSESWRDAINTYDGRLTISVPPQQGKTVTSRWAVFWALLQDPNRRVVYASYGMGLARDSGREIRNFVEMYGEPYGLRLDTSHRDAADWQLAGFRGGVLSASVESLLTGKPSDVLVLDDLLPGEQEANSPTEKARVNMWWESTARPRIGPGVPVVAIGTRWAMDDILSRFISEGWERINIPAKADGETFDSVADLPGGRTPDGYLVSTRGTTPADFELTKKDVGSRAWASLYLGRPAPVEGGVYQRDWFSQFREWEIPSDLDLVGVFVDPAETGMGDAAGILVAGRTREGRIPFFADYTGQYSAAEWGRRACFAWLEWNANRIVQERNLGMRSVIPDAWAIIYRQAKAISDVEIAENSEERVEVALALLTGAGDRVAARRAQLVELLELWEKVLDVGPSGPRVVSITPRMSKRIRAESAAPAWETGRAYCVGNLPDMEFEAVSWVEGAPSPNILDTMSMATAHLEQAGAKATVARRPRHLQAVPTSTVFPLAR